MMFMEAHWRIESQFIFRGEVRRDLRRGTYWDSAAGKANADCPPSSNNTSSGGDGNKAGDHALNCTKNRRLLEVDHIADGPAEKRHSGCDIGVEDSGTSVCGSGIWITTIETVPPDPEDTCSDQDAEDVIWSGIFAVSCQAGTDPVCSNETCCSGRQMNDISTGIINDTSLEEESTSPKTVSSYCVGECDPEGNEDHPGVEVHPSEKSTCHDDDGDSRENKLEVYHGS